MIFIFQKTFTLSHFSDNLHIYKVSEKTKNQQKGGKKNMCVNGRAKGKAKKKKKIETKYGWVEGKEGFKAR